jgi:ribose/xylose/arabinose/galactoside ABC-type transport system permease subunit
MTDIARADSGLLGAGAAESATGRRSGGPSGPEEVRRIDWATTLQRRGAILALAVVVLVGTFSFGGFLTTTNLQNIVLQSSFIGLITVGQTLVLITGGFDLSVGSMIGVTGVLAALAVGWWGPLGLLVPVAFGGAYGALNGFLVTKARLAPFIVTLAGLLGLDGLALKLAGSSEALTITGHADFTALGNGKVIGIDAPVIILMVAFALAALVLNRTRFGLGIFAVGGNEESARMMGVRVDRVKFGVYIISGLLAGLSGTLLAAQLHSGLPTEGTGYELQSIAAAVVGGTLLAGGSGTMLGSLAGVLLLGTIENLIDLAHLSSFTQLLVQGAFVIVVVALQRFLTMRRRQATT